MTPKFLLPCTAWLTTFHALPRSDISDLTKRGSTFCLLTRKTKGQDRSFSVKNLSLLTHPKGKSPRSIFLNQEPFFVYSPEKQKLKIDLSQSRASLCLLTRKAKAQDRSFLIKNLTLLTHPKGKKLKIDLS